MNGAKIRKILFFLLAFVSANCIAATPIKLLHCHIPSAKMTQNIQCLYSVYGQKIDKPQEFSKLYVNTNMPYALCRHALCDIDPQKPSVALCTCPIVGINHGLESWKKISVGPLFYEIIHPKFKGDQLESVPVNFSLTNTVNTKATKFEPITCKFDEPTAWANCSGKRCKVTYETKEDGKSTPIAECRCRIEKTTVFVSAGPRNTKECKTPENKVWSAMTERQVKNDIDVLTDIYKRFYPQSPPVKEAKEN